MSMDGNTLGTDIYNSLVASGKAIEDPDARTIWQQVAAEIVDHIKTYAVVNVSVNTTCAAGAGTGTGSSTSIT